ncbi:pilus assembly protein TadG-related protein [Mesorhizobium atlanticum]
MLPAIMGLSLLAIDMSRMNNLHNDLQKGTDALALAAAAELNGRSDAWTRAENALTNLVANNTTFSNANGGVVSLTTGNGAATVDPTYAACRSQGQVSWCFLASIPASDASPVTSANYAASPTVTRFIQVKAQPETFSAIFPVSIASSGGSTDTSYNISAVSVAGFTSGVCNYTPVFICNPFEMVNGTNTAGGATLEQAVSDPAIHRRLIELRLVGNNAAYGPGNFGFLQPPDGVGNGAQTTRPDDRNVETPRLLFHPGRKHKDWPEQWSGAGCLQRPFRHQRQRQCLQQCGVRTGHECSDGSLDQRQRQPVPQLQ